MIKWLVGGARNTVHAFLFDEAAFKRWLRAAGASLALVIQHLVSVADMSEWIAVVRTWGPKEWGTRIALGFFFASVYTPKPAAVTFPPGVTTLPGPLHVEGAVEIRGANVEAKP